MRRLALRTMQIRAAEVTDCGALARTSRLAFDHDVNYGAPGVGGPPGYDSVAWHRQALTWGRVVVLVLADRIVGGVVVVMKSGDHAELGRIWLEPAVQNQGWGAVALKLIEDMFPQVRRWTLDTPSWNQRNQTFYRSMGYVEVGRTPGPVYYAKLIDPDRTRPT